MLTRNEGERLAKSINSLRPDWPLPSLLTFIEKHAHMPLLDLTLQLTYVACDEKSKTPARMDSHGPWKYLLVGPRENEGPRYRYADPRDCGTCGRPEVDCRKDGHDYTPAFVRHDDRATPQQRAAVRAAIDPTINPLKRNHQEEA